jgi:hypothetical protein
MSPSPVCACRMKPTDATCPTRGEWGETRDAVAAGTGPLAAYAVTRDEGVAGVTALASFSSFTDTKPSRVNPPMPHSHPPVTSDGAYGAARSPPFKQPASGWCPRSYPPRLSRTGAQPDRPCPIRDCFDDRNTCSIRLRSRSYGGSRQAGRFMEVPAEALAKVGFLVFP